MIHVRKEPRSALGEGISVKKPNPGDMLTRPNIRDLRTAIGRERDTTFKDHQVRSVRLADLLIITVVMNDSYVEKRRQALCVLALVDQEELRKSFVVPLLKKDEFRFVVHVFVR